MTFKNKFILLVVLNKHKIGLLNIEKREMERFESSDDEILSDSDIDFNNLFNRNGRKFRIVLFSDFFYPRLGGVEMHIYQLGQ